MAPLLDIAQTLGSALAAFRHRRVNTIAMWLVHGLLLAALFAWMNHLGFSPLYFVLAISYPALALTKVRSFLEHRAADDPLARSVINEAGLVWRVLFLNLNYHSVHHDLPGYRGTGCEKSICIIRRSISGATPGLWCAATVNGCGIFARPVAVNAHPGFNQQGKADEEHE